MILVDVAKVWKSSDRALGTISYLSSTGTFLHLAGLSHVKSFTCIKIRHRDMPRPFRREARNAESAE